MLPAGALPTVTEVLEASIVPEAADATIGRLSWTQCCRTPPSNHQSRQACSNSTTPAHGICRVLV